MENQPMEERNRKLGEKTAANFEKRGFIACYVQTKEEAKEKALSFIKNEDTIAWGGCRSAEDTGLIAELRSGRYPNILDRDTAKTAEERQDMMRKAFFADVFIGGANGIAEDGQIVNIDGNGNRVAAMSFGPKSVIVIASVDKIMMNVMDAMARARMTAAPANAQRFDIKTPCKMNGVCADCLSPDNICCVFQRIRYSRPAGRIKVILVGEKLGF